MTPAIGFIFAGLLTAAPLADGARAPVAPERVIYECPQTYSLARTLRGEIICLRYRRDLRR